LEQHKQRIILNVLDCVSGTRIRLITEESAQTGCINVCLNVMHSNTLVFSKCRLLAFWWAHQLSHFYDFRCWKTGGFLFDTPRGSCTNRKGLAWF